MTTLVEIHDCDGFGVDTADGEIGRVEETWLDADGRPAALAVRTASGRRGLVLAEAVVDVRPDEHEVIVGRDARLLELGPPRLASGDGAASALLSASWRTTGALVELAAPTHPRPRLEAPSRPERALWRTFLLVLTSVTTLAVLEIGLAFLAAYLATGHAY